MKRHISGFVQAGSSAIYENPYAVRRHKLANAMGSTPVVVFAGVPLARNYAANPYPFRASSHFLYLTGLTNAPGAALVLHGGQSTLFVEPHTEADELWHGPQPTWTELQQQSGVDEVHAVANLDEALKKLPSFGQLPLPSLVSELDEQVAQAIISLRLIHDEAAVAEMRRAAAVTHNAHIAGMRATQPGVTEAYVRAAMERQIQAADFTTAYSSIVTVHGHVLHNHHYTNICQLGDLLLADVGAETDTGWASDVTRTWPVSGRFNSLQKDVYDVVLSAQKRAIELVRPGVRYRDIHLAACHLLARGLCDLGILKGNPEDLVARGVHALFFPHGVGHLIGLDVHDMEDLTETRAAYPPGRQRSKQFGLSYLRLDRDLTAGMAVTIEPGLYFIEALWRNKDIVAPFQSDVNWDKAQQFQSVRGIRIEDDVLVAQNGCEVLTAFIPKEAKEIEAHVGRGEWNL